MPVTIRLRDTVNKIAPVWLRSRKGFDVGYRVLWNVAALFDTLIDKAVEGAEASFPGYGTPTALPYIGRTRGIVQGIGETDDHYAERLRGWLATHANDRTIELAKQIHEYLPGRPRVRLIQRGRPFLLPPILPLWITVDTDGTVTETNAPWDWDSISNPERERWWSDMWIVIYPTPYARRPGTLGGVTDDGKGLGQMSPQAQVQALRAILADWKGAHSRIRAVLWTSDATAYVPNGSGIMPNGKWGQWSDATNNVVRGKSDRDLTVTRYTEPSRTPEP